MLIFSKLIFFWLLFFFLSNSIIQCYDSTITKFGIYGGVNINQHTADFYKLAGIPNCCPNFEEGSGLGFNAGLLYEHKIFGDFWLGARLGLVTLDGNLKKEEPTTIITLNGIEQGMFEHSMIGRFMNLGLEPTLIYNPFGGLLINAGMRLGLNLTKKFDQKETITKPAGVGTFLDSLGNDTGKRTRNEYSGDIPNANALQMFLTGGISYELPLNKDRSLRLVPELAYYYPLTELVQNTSWKVTSIRGGIALKYAPVPKPPKQKLYEKKYDIDTIRIPKDFIAENQFVPGKEIIKKEKAEDAEKIIEYQIVKRTDTIFTPKPFTLEGSITAVGVDDQGKEIENPIFRIEEIVSNRLDPLLNYIFFEDGSSEIPNRYKKLNQDEAKNFEIVSLFEDNTLEIYYNILNIVGRRLTKYPDANLTILGCNSDLGSEKGNLKLSEDRAIKVRDYLINVWNISPSRLKIEKRNLPQKPSTPIVEPDKIQENRRVELYSNNDKILEPIFIEKVDRKANPPIARFKPTIKSKAGLKDWELTSYQNSSPNLKFNEKDKSTIPEKIDWKLEEFQKIIPRKPEPIVYSLQFSDLKGQNKEITNKTLPIEVITVEEKRKNRIGDYEIEKFSLILFDFDKATIEGGNKRIVEFITGRIKPESEINITGYTDRTGDDKYNQQLSERRAKATQQALKRNDAKAVGIGEQKLLYDNDLPEGRFYCRTVEIEVRTKVK